MTPIHDQVILVTGATDGIGRLTAERLAAMGAMVLIHGRNAEKCQAAREAIQRRTAARIQTFVADFSELAQVRSLADRISAEHSRLHVLINNAGIGLGPSGQPRTLSADGFELRLAVNYLAPLLLTRLLLPSLRTAAPARIVNVSSAAQEAIDFDDVMLEEHYSPMRAYSRSKLALTMFTFDLAEEVRGGGITVNCLHPGTLLDTKMVRETFGAPRGSAETGANAEVFLATDPSLAGVTGRYYFEQREARADGQAYDPRARQRLRELSARLVGLS